MPEPSPFLALMVLGSVSIAFFARLLASAIVLFRLSAVVVVWMPIWVPSWVMPVRSWGRLLCGLAGDQRRREVGGA